MTPSPWRAFFSGLLNSFFALFPLLRPGGFYIIEDWGTGYWSDWPDGKTFQSHICTEVSGGLPRRIKSHDFGMVGLIKLLIDYVAGSDVRPTHGSPKTRAQLIDMMEVHFGIVLLKKAGIPVSKSDFLPIAREDRDHWRTQTEATQRLLDDATAKRPWWKRLAG